MEINIYVASFVLTVINFLTPITSAGHAVGRDAFVDHKMIVPLSELVRTIFTACAYYV